MTDNIITRLEQLASNYKTNEFEFLHADYEAVCEAACFIEACDVKVKQLTQQLQNVWRLADLLAYYIQSTHPDSPLLTEYDLIKAKVPLNE